MINLHERMLPTSAGVEPTTSWSPVGRRIQLSHRGRPKVKYRAVIRYLYLKGKTGKEIHGQLADVYGSSAPSYAQVKFWVGEFIHGRTSLEDEATSGHPLDATDKEMCKKVRDVVYTGRRIQVEEIAQALSI